MRKKSSFEDARNLEIKLIVALVLPLFLFSSVAIADFSVPISLDNTICTDSLAYDLLIITPVEFQPAAEPLAVHKSATGMPTTLKTLEHICGRFPGADDPEKIKRAIEHYHRFNGIKYVMLVGDVDKFPVRWVTHEQTNQPETQTYYFPSDLYYADLYDADGDFNTWNSDGDEYFGEHLKNDRCGSDPYSVNADHADLHPDVAVGRVPASYIEEVESYVAKVIRYEYLTADADSDWFHNVLLLAGRSRANYCDPGIHFNDTQTYLGDAFRYGTYIDESYYNAALDDKRNCECDVPPGNPNACSCLTGFTDDQKAIFQDANGFLWPDPSDFVNIGFLGWHDHTWDWGPTRSINYSNGVNNSDRFTIAFSDGCSDGSFAGGPAGGKTRFAPTGAGGHDLPYMEVGGRIIQVIFDDIYIDTDGDGKKEKFYNITNCTINGTWYSIDGCLTLFPDMSFCDDFDDSGNLVGMNNSSYIFNPPLPVPLQPDTCDRKFNPENTLFAKNSTSGVETGWVGLVAATKGTNFPLNGELESLFFRSYNEPHSSVSPSNHLGDMWRSMLEYWLEEVFDDAGNFDFTEFFDKYDISSDRYNTFCWRGIESTMMNALFGDPSLRVGGVTGLEDNDPPVTFCPDGDWYGGEDVVGDEITILLTAIDHGDPPSGVRETRYQVDNGTWETGNHVTIEAPSDHSNDGIHRIDYYSIDFLGNNETEKTATIVIDTYIPPAATRVFLDGEEQPAMVICTCYCPDPDDCECECPERGCYVDNVTVSFNATDAPPSTLPSIPVSGIDYTEYDLHGWPYGIYTAPFSVRGGDILDRKNLRYWSWDNAGNEELHKSVSFCVSNWKAGLMRDKIRILAALEEIIAFRMRKDFVDTLPLIKSVYFEAAGPYPTEQPKWTTIGTDYNGDDGWGVMWDTNELSNGDYYIRMTAMGPGGMASAQLQQDQVIYQEQLNVTVCNIPNSSYAFNLIAPDEIDRGEVIEYTLKFANEMDYSLTNLNMICDIDMGFFDKIKVLDEGYLSKEGRPTWFRKELKSRETWKVHFNGWTKPDIYPGTVITSQALITADTVPLLLSDDPTTPEEDDYTAVAIRLINGSITGKVEDEKYGTPIMASVAIDGPVTQKATTDVNGSYLFSDLLPGIYNVSVDAENYDYHSPTGPVTVTLDGTRASIQVDFFMALNDTIPPVSSILLSADEIVQESMTEIYGTAYDYAPGSGVRKVELSVERNNDRKYWDGDSWGDKETWLLASGTTKWAFKCGGITWDSNFSYALKSRATDNAGNVERPTVITTTSTLQAPALISPANGTSVEYIPTFEWSYVLDSCYYLQIDNDNDFQSPEIDVSYLTYNTYTPREIEEGTYYWRVKAVDMERGYPESEWSEVWAVTILTKPTVSIFDTRSSKNPYPSIMGNHTGTIKPNHTVIATKLYTHPCAGTGGHTEYVKIWNLTWNATATWKGYVGDWKHITFGKTVVLLANETYNYTIRTGSYPQIHHNKALTVPDGEITCSEFIDANGRHYDDWIPAIRLE